MYPEKAPLHLNGLETPVLRALFPCEAVNEERWMNKTTHKATLWNVISYNFFSSGPKPPKENEIQLSTIRQIAFRRLGILLEYCRNRLYKYLIQKLILPWDKTRLSLAGEAMSREVYIHYMGFLPVWVGNLWCDQKEITWANEWFCLDCTVLTIGCTREVASIFLTLFQSQMCTLHLINKKYRFNSWTYLSQTGAFPEVIQIVSYPTQSLHPKGKPRSFLSSLLMSKPSTPLSPRSVYAFQEQNYKYHPEKKPKKKWLSLVFQCTNSFLATTAKDMT